MERLPKVLVSGWDGAAVWFREWLGVPTDGSGSGPVGGVDFEGLRTQFQGETLPTVEQSQAFAEHVAGKEPLVQAPAGLPSRRLVLLRAQSPGGTPVCLVGGEDSVWEVVEPSYFSHHSRLSTAEYRSRFGLWDYLQLGRDTDRVPTTPFTTPAGFGSRRWCGSRSRERSGCGGSPNPIRAAFREFARGHQDDPDAARYLELDALFDRQPTELQRYLEPESEAEAGLRAFLEAERTFQRQRLREGLLRARKAWGQVLAG